MIILLIIMALIYAVVGILIAVITVGDMTKGKFERNEIIFTLVVIIFLIVTSIVFGISACSHYTDQKELESLRAQVALTTEAPSEQGPDSAADPVQLLEYQFEEPAAGEVPDANWMTN